MIQIAVMGYGTVGSGVVEVLNTNQASINKRAGDEINIKYVLDLRDFPGDPVESKLIHDFETIVNDPEIKIVVEVMGGVEPAYTFTKRCLEAGKSVCTSNKELVARHGAELLEIARERDDIKVCKVNVDDNMELAKTYRVMGIPQIIIFRDGKKVDDIQGAQPISAFAQVIERNL